MTERIRRFRLPGGYVVCVPDQTYEAHLAEYEAAARWSYALNEIEQLLDRQEANPA
jgi:hypothetical protein